MIHVIMIMNLELKISDHDFRFSISFLLWLSLRVIYPDNYQLIEPNKIANNLHN
jgi:hypothetical protein